MGPLIVRWKTHALESMREAGVPLHGRICFDEGFSCQCSTIVNATIFYVSTKCSLELSWTQMTCLRQRQASNALKGTAQTHHHQQQQQ